MSGIGIKNKARASMEPIPLRFIGDDRALVCALKLRHPGAMEALYDRYAVQVEHVLARVLGFDPELYDLLQEVFIKAFHSVRRMKDGQALQAWLTALTVFTAGQCIRKRRRRRVYWVRDAEPHLDLSTFDISPEDMEALRLTYSVLETMNTDDRIVFSLRFIQGMDIAEVAKVCGVSLSTAKRRLKRAESRFEVYARRFPALSERIGHLDRRRSS